MENEAITSLIEQFKALSPTERENFLSYIATRMQPCDEKFIIDARFGSGLVCPHCGASGKGVSKKGKTPGGKQRFICQHCRKTFVATTNSVMYNSKLDFSVWKQYLQSFLNGKLLYQAAEECGISKLTAWRWRHKICDSLRVIMDEIHMSGIVEADETYFRLSFTGNHTKSTFVMPRKARKRGKGLHEKRKRGLSAEQICVPCVVNRSGQSVARIAGVGNGSYEGISAVISEHISADSTICADKAASYKRIASEIGCELVKLSTAQSKGMFSIQRINAYHRRMKLFVEHFYGISSKHLNNYLAWYNFAWYAKETFTEKVRIITQHICSVPCYTRVREISKRPAIPYINDKVRRSPYELEATVAA